MACERCKRNDLFVAAMGGGVFMANVTGSLAATFAGMLLFPLLLWALRKRASVFQLQPDPDTEYSSNDCGNYNAHRPRLP